MLTLSRPSTPRDHLKIEPMMRLSNSILLGVAFVLLLAQPAPAADPVESSGDVLALLLPAVAFSSTFYQHDDEGRSRFYTSFFANLAATSGLKFAVDKRRPNGKKHSFPSAHTSITFQSAAFLHRRYGIKPAVPAYLAAAFVGYSRLDSSNHYPEDVLAGAALGIFSGWYLTTPRHDLVVTPSVGNGVYTITFSKFW